MQGILVNNNDPGIHFLPILRVNDNFHRNRAEVVIYHPYSGRFLLVVKVGLRGDRLACPIVNLLNVRGGRNFFHVVSLDKGGHFLNVRGGRNSFYVVSLGIGGHFLVNECNLKQTLGQSLVATWYTKITPEAM